MRPRWLIAIPLLALAAPAGGADGRVVIENVSYVPDEVTVTVGDTVTWEHRDGNVPHTVTAKDGSFDSNGLCEGALQTSGNCMTGGETYTTPPFEQAGVVDYFCKVHPSSMQGRVVVEAAPTTTTTAVPATTTTEDFVLTRPSFDPARRPTTTTAPTAATVGGRTGPTRRPGQGVALTPEERRRERRAARRARAGDGDGDVAGAALLATLLLAASAGGLGWWWRRDGRSPLSPPG